MKKKILASLPIHSLMVKLVAISILNDQYQRLLENQAFHEEQPEGYAKQIQPTTTADPRSSQVRWGVPLWKTNGQLDQYSVHP
jgi:hypothetical protein